MNLLSSLTMRDMRRIEGQTFPDSFVVNGVVAAADTSGGYPTTPTTVSTGACRLREGAGNSEQALADRLSWTVFYSIDLPVGTVVTPVNTITVNGARTFEIGGVVDTETWAVKRTLIVREIG